MSLISPVLPAFVLAVLLPGVLVLPQPAYGQESCEPHWAEGFAPLGLDGPVNALTVFDDGSGPALYAGGNFSTAGGVAANYIARWNGESWASVGGGMNSSVHALVVFDDGSGPALYAGGNFSAAGGVVAHYIAKWDGSSWSPLGSGMNTIVRALAVFNDADGPALDAGGNFTSVGGTMTVNRIAKWNGTNWSPLGAGMGGYYAPVNALAVFDDASGRALYAGGSFTTAGGMAAMYIAKWNGSNWSPLSGGLNQAVYALTVFDDGTGPALCVGGGFTIVGGAPAGMIAKWNGSNWSLLGHYGMNGAVRALSVFDDGSGPALYAGGTFATADDVAANSIAKWNGSNWSALDSGMGMSFPNVSALAVFDDGSGPALYVGGNFTTAGGLPSSNIAKWVGCTPAKCAGDANCDGSVTFADIDPFVARLGCPDGNPAACATGCAWQNTDVNADGSVTFADIDPFVARLGATCP